MFDYLFRVLSRKGWVKSKESEEKSDSDFSDKSNEDKEEVQKHWDDSGLKDALHLLTLEPEKLQWDVYEKIDEILDSIHKTVSFTTKHHLKNDVN